MWDKNDDEIESARYCNTRLLYFNILQIICVLDPSDNMEPKTSWRYLDNSLLVEIPDEPGKQKIEPGSGSQEKKRQILREQSVLQALYFTRNM